MARCGRFEVLFELTEIKLSVSGYSQVTGMQLMVQVWFTYYSEMYTAPYRPNTNLNTKVSFLPRPIFADHHSIELAAFASCKEYVEASKVMMDE